MTIKAALTVLDLLVKLVVGIAWPLAAIFIVFILRQPLREVLSRLKRAGWKDGYLEFPQVQGQAPTTDPLGSTTSLTKGEGIPPQRDSDEKRVPPKNFIPAEYRNAVNAASAFVRNALPAMQTRVEGSREEILTEWLAESTVALSLEKASRAIFESQLSALDALKEKVKLTREDFRPFYDAAARNIPEVYNPINFPFERWFKFFTEWNLVDVVGDEVAISPLGQVLKRYMGERGVVPTAKL